MEFVESRGKISKFHKKVPYFPQIPLLTFHAKFFSYFSMNNIFFATVQATRMIEETLSHTSKYFTGCSTIITRMDKRIKSKKFTLMSSKFLI